MRNLEAVAFNYQTTIAELLKQEASFGGPVRGCKTAILIQSLFFQAPASSHKDLAIDALNVHDAWHQIRIFLASQA